MPLRRLPARLCSALVFAALLPGVVHAKPRGLQLRTLGAARMVTGSMHLLKGRRGNGVLVDAGLFQGSRECQRRNSQPLSRAAVAADALVLTHVHVDHCGMIPRLVKEGFKGKIYMSKGSAALIRTMLRDSAHIQKREVLNQKRKLLRQIDGAKYKLKIATETPAALRKGDPELLVKVLPEEIARLRRRFEAAVPAYTKKDVEQALARIVEVDYGQTFEPSPGMKVFLKNPGHIFGSASVIVDAEVRSAKTRRIAFSGDIGRRDSLLFDPPDAPENADYVVMEGTNGDALHPPLADVKQRLDRVISDAARGGGKVIIPAFTFGRTQELLYLLSQLSAEGKLSVPVFVDSPMGVEITGVFSDNLHCFNRQVRQHAERVGGNPFTFPGLKLVKSVEQSKALMNHAGPAVIISSSGMCDAGRIRHHLTTTINDSKNTVLFVGYQANGTLGRRLLAMRDANARSCKINVNGKRFGVAARIAQLPAMHGHGDQQDLMCWVKGAGKKLRKVFLVHGDENRLRALGNKLEQDGMKVEIPREDVAMELR